MLRRPAALWRVVMLRRPAALFALLLVCALVAGCAGASGAAGANTSRHAGARGAGRTGSRPSRSQQTHQGTGGVKSVSIRVAGRRRTYLLYVPPGDTATHPLPLVLVLHGAGDTAAHTVDETDLPNIARQGHNMILVFPQGYEDTWNEGAGRATPAARAGINDVQFIATILRRVESHYAVNRHRVVVTGFSNGALLTEDLGCTLSRQLTMIAPVEGQLPQQIASRCHPPDPLTVFEVHGTADTAIPYQGGSFTGVNGLPGPPVLSAPDSAARWATIDHCPGQAQTSVTGSVTFATYGGCQDGVSVTLATVNGGQHQWPQGYGPTLANEISRMPNSRTAIP